MTFTELSSIVQVLAGAAVVTVVLAVITIVVSSLVAVVLAFATSSLGGRVAFGVSLLSWIARGIPDLVVVLFTFYGLTTFGPSLDPFQAVLVGMCLSSFAYYLEIFRGGLASIPKTQYEAGRALGLTPLRTFRRIIFPQVATIVRQPFWAQCTTVVKHTSIASVVAVPELLGMSTRIIAGLGHPFEVLLIVGMFYVALNSVLLYIGARQRPVMR